MSRTHKDRKPGAIGEPADVCPLFGPFIRIRRGEVVVIPQKWVRNTTHHETIRKRRSHQTAPQRRAMNNGWASARARHDVVREAVEDASL